MIIIRTSATPSLSLLCPEFCPLETCFAPFQCPQLSSVESRLLVAFIRIACPNNKAWRRRRLPSAAPSGPVIAPRVSFQPHQMAMGTAAPDATRMVLRSGLSYGGPLIAGLPCQLCSLQLRLGRLERRTGETVPSGILPSPRHTLGNRPPGVRVPAYLKNRQ